MKILMLNYEFPPLGGGASPISFEIAKHLSENIGFTIDVVTMGYNGLPNIERINNNLTVYRVKSIRSKKEICHPWEQLSYIISGYIKCKKLIRTNKYDLCYCHFIIPTGVLAKRLKSKFGIPYIITSHGSDVLGYNPRFKKLYPILVKPWKSIVMSANKITTPSEFLRNIISGIDQRISNKLFVIPNGIEANKFKPSIKENIILSVARLTPNKGIQKIITAMKKINNWKLIIVGDGPYRNTLINLVQKLDLQNKVEFTGWLNNDSEELKNLYSKSSIFVLPSDFENMNVTLLEAMQSGCAIIATDVGGNREVIHDAGLLYENSSVSNLTDKLLLLTTSPEKVKFLSNKAINRISDHFTWDKIINKYVNIFKDENYAMD